MKHIILTLCAFIVYNCPSFAQTTCSDESSISIESATSIYHQLKQSKFKINYMSADNGCDERAVKIHNLLNNSNIKTWQSFVQTETQEDCGITGAACLGQSGIGNKPTIFFESIYDDRTFIWGFHTAPVLCVSKGSKTELYAMDLSTFLKPVPLTTWQKKLTKNLGPEDYSYFTRDFL